MSNALLPVVSKNGTQQQLVCYFIKTMASEQSYLIWKQAMLMERRNMPYKGDLNNQNNNFRCIQNK